MRLFLIETNTTLEGHRRLYARLKDKDAPDVRHVFLVPDRFTLGVERDLCEYCFPDGYSRADVASFTRYAVKTVGKKINRCLTKEGTVVLLQKVMSENAGKLRYYRKLTGYGFAKELFAAIASLRSGGVTVEEVEAAAAGDGVLSDKLKDIALIMKEYDRRLKEGYSDTVTRIDSLTDYLSKNADLLDTRFYVLGFNMFSAQQMKLIGTLAEFGAEVCVAYVAVPGAESPGGQAEKLADYCRERGIAVEREFSFELVPQPFEYLRGSLFGAGKKLALPSGKGRVALFSEETPYAEALAAAREIVWLTRKVNYRFKDVAVACNDRSLLPVIRETFDRCGIPCFLDEGYAVANGVAVKYVLTLLDAAEGCSAADLFKLAQHPFTDLSREESEAFERYCVKYNIKYDRFKSPFTLGDSEIAERVRRKLFVRTAQVPLLAPVSRFCRFIRDITEEEFIASKLAEYGESREDRLVASADLGDFLRLTEELSLLRGEEETTAADFTALLRAAIADMKVALKPDCYDTVFVGNTDESRFSEVKALFILGAADGYFPIKSGDGLIFSAADNANMRRRGLNVFPSPVEKNAFERFIARDLLAKPSERLYVGCAETDLSGEAQSAGEGFRELLYLTDAEAKPLASYRDLTENERLNYLLVNPRNAYAEYLAGTVPAEFREEVKRFLREEGLLTERVVSSGDCPFERYFRTDGDGVYMTSVSQLETYFTCPFKHFMRYGLRAREEEDSVLKPLAMGNAIHNVLESFFRRNLDAVYDGGDLTAETRAAIEREFAKREYERYYADPVSAHILKGVKKECAVLISALAENMRASDFRPIGFEVGFGYRKDDNMLLINVENRRFKLCGKIDRVDACGRDVAIIDYKTGSVKPDLKDVRCGRKIQLYVYMSYYMKKGYRPAGVFYLPIRSGNTASGRSYAYVGQMLDDPSVYRALDRRAERASGRYSSPALSFKADVHDGEIKLLRSGNLLSEKEFRAAARYVEALAENALSEILAGFAEKKPLKGSCEYCEYRSMCGEMPPRTAPAANAGDFEREERKNA